MSSDVSPYDFFNAMADSLMVVGKHADMPPRAQAHAVHIMLRTQAILNELSPGSPPVSDDLFPDPIDF